MVQLALCLCSAHAVKAQTAVYTFANLKADIIPVYYYRSSKLVWACFMKERRTVPGKDIMPTDTCNWRRGK